MTGGPERQCAGGGGRARPDRLGDRELASLLANVRRWRSLRGWIADEETFDQLTIAVTEAVRWGESPAQLRERIAHLEREGVACAREILRLVR